MRYKLPEALGGGEAVVIEWEDHPAHPSFASLEIDGVVVIVPHEHLTEVPEPLPEEPPVGSVVLDADNRVWQRMTTSGNWQGLTGGQVKWEWLAEHHQLVRLLPAPEPVTLPWRDDEGAVVVQLFTSRDCHSEPPLIQLAADNPTEFGPATARAMANALWTAADQAEAVDRG